MTKKPTTTRSRVRLATLEDFPVLLALALEFIAEDARMRDTVPGEADEPGIWAFGQRMLETGGLFVLEAADGDVVGFMALSAWPNAWTGELVANEEALWITPGARGDLRALYNLVGAAELWARQIGAGCLRMTAPELGSFGKFLARAGFVPLERVLLKRVANGLSVESPNGARDQTRGQSAHESSPTEDH
jgi:hypothetical protein